MAYRKRSPTVLQVPNGSGVGGQQPIQVPISDDSIISLTNLSAVSLTLCNDETFSTTWPLPAGATNPQPGIDNLWIQNSSGSDAEVLVLTYDARFPGLVPPTSGPSGYASLTGPGQTVTPGDLDQEGGFTVNDVNGDGINLLSTDGRITIGATGFLGSLYLTTDTSNINLLAVGGVVVDANKFNVATQAGMELSDQVAISIHGPGPPGAKITIGTTDDVVAFFNVAGGGPQVSGGTTAGVIAGLVNLGLFSS